MVLAQQVLTVVLVLGALGYLAWRGWMSVRAALRQRKSGACGPDCGCDG